MTTSRPRRHLRPSLPASCASSWCPNGLPGVASSPSPGDVSIIPSLSGNGAPNRPTTSSSCSLHVLADAAVGQAADGLVDVGRAHHKHVGQRPAGRGRAEGACVCGRRVGGWVAGLVTDNLCCLRAPCREGAALDVRVRVSGIGGGGLGGRAEPTRGRSSWAANRGAPGPAGRATPPLPPAL